MFIRAGKSHRLVLCYLFAAKFDDILWKPSAESRRVMNVLSESSAGEPQVLFVGGYVRNTLLGLPQTDADMATVLAPDIVTQRLEAAGIRVIPTGIDHGTVTAVINGHSFEITTLRRDVETDGRHAVVAFTTDWSEDAQRRDFTMNTLLADTEGNVYDPTGRGIQDAMLGHVVFVGDPAQRIAEDYLRILRFFRFHASYGQGEPDAAAMAACAAAADKITTLSRERITQEIFKILGGIDPTDILETMADNNVMADFLHAEFQPDALSMLSGLQNRLGEVSLEARLYLVCGGDKNHRAKIDKYLLFSKDQVRNLESFFTAVMAPYGIEERIYRFGRYVGGQSILILASLEDATIGKAEIEIIRDWPIPVLPIAGDDLKSLGMEPGPEMGRVLRAVEEWWIGKEFSPDRDQCRDQAKKIMQAAG